MPVKPLPSHPNLEHLKHQAKDLLKDHAARDAAAAQRLREFHPAFTNATEAAIFAARLKLADAQLAIAREHGFPSWTRLKRSVEKPTPADRLELPHHERIEDGEFRRAVQLIDTGDAPGLREQLQRHPELTRQRVLFEGGNYFRNPALLEFVAENPVRHGKLPPNIAEVAKVILDAGVEQAPLNEALMLVATGRVPRECGVQRAPIDLLCDYGADADNALQAAALHDELDAVKALLGRGAKMTLAIAAALGLREAFEQMLPGASARERHLAMAMAAQFNRVEIMRRLLDAGEDPNGYNPVGAHSHATPVHQAALRGSEEMVRLLVDRGADVNRKDVLWQGTAADWAEHAGHEELGRWLRG